MPHPQSSQLTIEPQSILDDGTECSFVTIKNEEPETWTTFTIYSSGGSAETIEEKFKANKAYAERIIKALALLEFFEVCEPTKQFLNTYHENN